jgi:DNA-binding LacI/PurR family transcriptional regulator
MTGCLWKKINLRMETNIVRPLGRFHAIGKPGMSEQKIRTMEEFAAASGLSRPTVSKYFDNPDSVKPSTRARIEKAVKDYDYRPNIFAVSLNRKQPKNIGVIVPHISDPFYAEVVRQIEMRCLAEGYWAIVLSSHGERKLEARAMRTLMSLNIAGVLMAPLGFETDAALLASLVNAMPIVFLDNRVNAEQPFVGTDNRQSIGNITEYLCRTGEHPCFPGNAGSQPERAGAPRGLCRNHGTAGHRADPAAGLGRGLGLRGTGIPRGQPHIGQRRFSDPDGAMRQ